MYPRLYVDARSLKANPVGVARYVTEMVYELSNLGYKITLISNKDIIIPEKIKKESIDVNVYDKYSKIPGTIFVSLLLSFILPRNAIFLGFCHCIPLFRVKSVLFIHDIVAYRYPETMTLLNKWMNRFSFTFSLKRAKKVITVSKFTKNEIVDFFSLDPKAIMVARNSIDVGLFKNNNSPREKFILAVGSIEPRKNINSLVKAFFTLIEKDNYVGDLLIVGPSGWLMHDFFKEVQSSPYSSRVKFTGFVSDVELSLLYNSCELFVFPSIYEGFGIPPLEALSCGAKVICTTQSEIPNMDLDDITFFDPAIDDLYTLIKDTLVLENERYNFEYNESWAKNADIISSEIKSI
ncbi:glycosyltransferase family 4 protein [Photobacterium leiognathi]|uniref:glycosyltransferase family 4 protein n=1 Tax=Photobacterium leiognathi TaxID=553611 RepID=UPI002982549C|nr:glycosyltransferase family 1 protein [Photobacterium leiognathi]